MRAKQVYEFVQKKSLRSNLKDQVGIKYKIKKDIIDWFDKYAPDANYNITENLNIIVNNSLDLQNKEIKSIPNNLYVHGYLFLENNPIAKLPENLTTTWTLNINNTNIEELPPFPNFNISGPLYARDGKLKYIPDNFSAKNSLILSNSPISKLPKNLHVGKFLYIAGTNITELPEDLDVGQFVCISPSFNIDNIPPHINYEIKDF